MREDILPELSQVNQAHGIEFVTDYGLLWDGQCLTFRFREGMFRIYHILGGDKLGDKWQNFASKKLIFYFKTARTGLKIK